MLRKLFVPSVLSLALSALSGCPAPADDDDEPACAAEGEGEGAPSEGEGEGASEGEGEGEGASEGEGEGAAEGEGEGEGAAEVDVDTESEPNGTPQTADAYADPWYGTLSDALDVDCVSWFVEADHSIFAAIYASDGVDCQDHNMNIAISGPGLNAAPTSDLCPQVTTEPLDGGTYQVCVFATGQGSAIPYNLFLEDRSCGDGIVDPGEQCDDENGTDGDGCNSQCVIEQCLAPLNAQLGDNSGTLTGVPTVAESLSCHFSSAAGDNVWMFMPAATGQLTVTVQATEGRDWSVWARSDCGAQASEVGCADDGFVGDPETMTIPAVMGVPVYIFVSGFSLGDDGPYTLTIQAS